MFADASVNEDMRNHPQMHTDTSVNAPASLYSTDDATDGKIGYRSSEDVDGISNGSEMFASAHLICSGGHQSRRPPHGHHKPLRSRSRPCRIITDLRSCSSLAITPLHRKSMGAYYIVNFNFPFKLGPKVGLHIIHKCVL